MKQDYYKTPELKHNIVFRENFFEKPKLFQSSLNEQVIKSIETFLDEKYNFLKKTSKLFFLVVLYKYHEFNIEQLSYKRH